MTWAARKSIARVFFMLSRIRGQWLIALALFPVCGHPPISGWTIRLSLAGAYTAGEENKPYQVRSANEHATV